MLVPPDPKKHALCMPVAVTSVFFLLLALLLIAPNLSLSKPSYPPKIFIVFAFFEIFLFKTMFYFLIWNN